jgi:carbon-monoxide dehydrogenase medium subunit
MYATTYHRPATLAEAARLLADNPDAKLLAGGQTLLPTMKQRLAAPSGLIDIGRLKELKVIEVGADAIVIGAGCTHADIADGATVRGVLPSLADLASVLGDPQVRHMGTLGGSVANNDPAADYPAALLALGATIRTDRREIAAKDFFTGLFETALEDGEIVTAVSFPYPERAAYEKLRNPASRYAMAGAFVARLKSGEVRVAISGAGPTAFRSADLEAALTSAFTPEAALAVTISPDGLNGDLHASAEYRAALIPVAAARAVAKALA